jgi:2,3-bisphosphoglycerate-independent phosphoglycerate mutase
MMDFSILEKLQIQNDKKVVLFIMDGLGGLPRKPGGKTELETAKTPTFDRLAKEGMCGLHQPIGPGIMPGSGPAHLGVFGYDPIVHQVGRGVLEAIGINFALQEGDVASRGNFCTIDSDGLITDRRAGRIATEINEKLCEKLRAIKVPGVEVFVDPVKEHRLLVVLRGKGLSGEIEDTDPQAEGKAPLDPKPITKEAKKTAELFREFLKQAKEVLKDEHPANMMTLRGFASKPSWPSYLEVFGVRAGAIASYPMYRGVASLVGMDVLETGPEVPDEFDTLEKRWNDYDFFFFHVKKTDSYGENGDFDSKVHLIEEVDKQLHRLLDLKPDVLVVTGDHSTPAAMKSHSWHPVPVLMWGQNVRPDRVTEFGERPCMAGALGPRIAAVDLMPIAMAHAGKIEKFGA